MDALTAFGLFAVTAMLVFYALEDRSPWYILAFAAACALASAYGFLQGAWPFGVIEVIFTGAAVWRWRTRIRNAQSPRGERCPADVIGAAAAETATETMAGPPT
jgi:4-amino-4-deoxy-L-arabinose transferase-like glycosyltransferase